mgnify:CR=1 FL=1
MKSEKAKEFIDGCMDHLTVEMTDHAKWQLRAAMTRAAELAEHDARERMKRAFCLQICGERGNTESGCECTDFFDFLRYYDNE